MTSSRGPGVIGMIIALLVLLGFGLLFTFAFDEDLQGHGRSIESIVRSQQREINGYVEGIKDREERLALLQENVEISRELDETNREMSLLEETLTGLNEAHAKATQEFVNVDEAFEAYKEEYRAHVRAKAVGEEMDELTTVTGEVYKRVVIREVTPIGIQIRHEYGQKRLSFDELSDELKERFQYDPKKKDEALAQEHEMHQKHDAAVAVANQSFEKQQAEQKERQAVERKKEIVRTIAVLKARKKQLAEEIKSLEKGLRNQSGIKRTSDTEAVIQVKKNQLSSVVLEIARLQSEL